MKPKSEGEDIYNHDSKEEVPWTWSTIKDEGCVVWDIGLCYLLWVQTLQSGRHLNYTLGTEEQRKGKNQMRNIKGHSDCACWWF